MEPDQRVQEILTLEQTLRQAILQRDIATLDQLLSDDFSYVNEFGQVVSKEQDIAVYRLGDVVVNSFDTDDINIRVYYKTAVVRLKVKLQVDYKMQPMAGTYWYTRVWVNHHGRWQIIVGQVTNVVN